MVKRKQRQPAGPGEILRDEFLLPMGLSQSAFAHHIGCPETRVEELVSGKLGLTADMAMVLADALATTPQFWLSLQAEIDLWRAEQKHKPVKSLASNRAATGVAAATKAQKGKSIEAIVPPEAGFYSKQISYKGIVIKAPQVVAGGALMEARKRIRSMLKNMPAVLANLVAEQAELHIIGKDQGTSDLPEHRHMKGVPFDGELDIDQRTRGVGGIWASCGEENLLKLQEDRYFGRDICVHEFAHTIYEYGFDDLMRSIMAQQLSRSIARGRWATNYASTNETEFFAELSMWYFGTRGDYGSQPLKPAPKPGPAWLQRYDEEAFRLLHDIYSGKIAPKLVHLTELAAGAPELEGEIKSIAARTTTSVRFYNRTLKKVSVYWLDYNGKRKLYGQIEPGGRYSGQTFVTHPWLITDLSGKGLAVFLPTQSPGIGYIK